MEIPVAGKAKLNGSLLAMSPHSQHGFGNNLLIELKVYISVHPTNIAHLSSSSPVSKQLEHASGHYDQLNLRVDQWAAASAASL